MSQATDDSKTFKIYAGSTLARLSLLKWPTVVTHSIAEGWPEEKIQSLKNAVQILVKANPILTGTLQHKNSEIHVTTGQYNPDKHSFVIEVTPPEANKLPSPQGLSPTECMEYINKYVDKSIPKGVAGEEEMKKQLPLFAIYVMRLPDNHMYYSLQVSHAIGDGSTYYYLMEQLNSLIQNNKIEKSINWDNELRVNWKFSKDPSFLQIICIVLGFFLSLLFRRHQNPVQCVLLDRTKIKEEKKHIISKTNKSKFLSANDVVCAAMFRSVCGRLKLANQLRSERGRQEGVNVYDGGNFFTSAEFEVEKGCDPNYIREELTNCQTKEAPALLPGLGHNMSRLLGKQCVMTNWGSLGSVLEGTKCNFPPYGFLESSPNCCFVMFAIDERYIGVMHNAGELRRHKLLDQLEVRPTAEQKVNADGSADAA